MLSKLVFPSNLRGISDPMSGFFAVRLDAFDLDAMRPRGFKILLEMLAREGQVTKAEVPFTFGERFSGESKASLREGITFFRQLISLRVSESLSRVRRRGRLQRGAGFAAVGLSGLGVNLLMMWLLADPRTLHLNYLLAAALTTQIASSWNFALVDTLVYRGAKRLSRLSRYLGFMAMSNAVLLLRIPFLALLVSVLGVHYLAANVLTLALGFLVRFRSQERIPPHGGTLMTALTDRPFAPEPPELFVPRQRASHPSEVGPARVPVDVLFDEGEAPTASYRERRVVSRGTGYLPYRYSVGGLVTIGSQVALRELELLRGPGSARTSTSRSVSARWVAGP